MLGLVFALVYLSLRANHNVKIKARVKEVNWDGSDKADDKAEPLK